MIEMKLFLFLLFFSTPCSALLLEKVQAQVGANIISQIDVEQLQTREQLNLLPSTVLLDSLYKNKDFHQENSYLFSSVMSSQKISQKNPAQKQKPSSLAVNYLIVRELLWQEYNKPPSPTQASMRFDNPDISQTFKEKQGKRTSTQFKAVLKTAGFNSSFEYQSFLKQEKIIDLFVMNLFASKTNISNRELEAAFFKTYKRKLFSNYEYEFLLVSFTEDEKQAILNSLEKKEHLKDFSQWASSLDLSVKKSKLKSHEIEKTIRPELDKLSISQVSPLLFINSSYHLLQLKWKEALTDSKDQAKKSLLEKELANQKLLQELAHWIQNKKDQSFIKLSSL